jgi:uncharacterized protein with PhoU and TrkA domain
MTSVTATDSAIAALILNEAEISVEGERSESHMLTMMRKYKKAAMTAARMMPNLATKPGTQSSKRK